jgi:hypothetical protein
MWVPRRIAVRMLNDVAPIDYGFPGQDLWAETVQWHKGDIITDSYFKHLFVDNGDAEYVECD